MLLCYARCAGQVLARGQADEHEGRRADGHLEAQRRFQAAPWLFPAAARGASAANYAVLAGATCYATMAAWKTICPPITRSPRRTGAAGDETSSIATPVHEKAAYL
jgi:hypothetical protein